jgi:hypothetical protein
MSATGLPRYWAASRLALNERPVNGKCFPPNPCNGARPNEELRSNLGDGVDQAAEIASRTISIPSLNFAPLMIFGNWF